MLCPSTASDYELRTGNTPNGLDTILCRQGCSHNSRVFLCNILTDSKFIDDGEAYASPRALKDRAGLPE